MHIEEHVRRTEVCLDVDIIVVGGSCTGVSAAVRAARLGKRVALIEVSNRFGGVAVNSLVNVWHSLYDEIGEKKIIAGLGEEIMQRLKKREAVIDKGKGIFPGWQFCFNSNELCLELDELVNEHPLITPFLHARVVDVIASGTQVQAVVIEDKTGRRAITGKMVVDASGDADVLRRLGVATRRNPALQPPTAAAIMSGVSDFDLKKEFTTNDGPLQSGFIWMAPVPGSKTAKAIFGTRVHGVDCSDADDLTKAEMEGRRQVREMIDHLRKQHGYDKDIALMCLPSMIGIRETVHACCHHTVTEMEVLEGVHFDDAIAFGSYRVDIHQQGGDGIIFKKLDGSQWFGGIQTPTEPIPERWREPREQDPTYYCVPYRSIVPRDVDNVFVAGRCIDSDTGAHAAIRVMINCNQTGEAAGVAAALCIDHNCVNIELDVKDLQQTLVDGGSELVTPTNPAPLLC